MANAVETPRNDVLCDSAQRVIQVEAEAVASIGARLDDRFAAACRLILNCTERVVVVGMGKSSHIGGKIASTLASTGTPAFFVHPGEASHGDLGMITPHDLVLALSNSGETFELLAILPIIKRMGVKLIALSGDSESTLGRQADVCLDVSVDKEACPLNLAPTASTIATMAMGDALAVALLEARGFTIDDFARSHPGGALGRRLLLYVSDIMHSGEAIPIVHAGDTIRDALVEMTGKGLGMTAVLDAGERLCGIFTDGDLRRALNQNIDVYTVEISTVMTTDPRTVTPETLAAEVVQLLRTHSINGVFVADPDRRVLGALNTLDLLRAGVV